MRTYLTQRHYDAAILVVDDMEFNRVLICDILEREGFTNLIQASNGAEALKIVDAQRIDLIILDLVMPVLDGFEFCRIMHQRKLQRRIPILVQTAMGDSQERLEIFNIGASDMIIKPINPSELLLRLCLHLIYAFSFNDLIEYHKNMEEEMELAQQAQLSLMPNDEAIEQLMQSHGVLIASYYQPSAKIGGDLWNITPLTEDRVAIYALDISGHGTSAAINAFRLHSLMRLEELKDIGPAEYLKGLNKRALSIFKTGQFAVAFVGVLDLEHNQLEYASAAFTTPMIFSPEHKEVRTLNSGGVPLGVTADAEYQGVKKKFRPNDSLLLYSDALIETKRKESDTFLDEVEIEHIIGTQLAATTSAATRQSRTVAALLGAIHAGENNQHVTDDLMIVVCTRTR